MSNFRIFRDISSPSLFAVHRVDSDGNRVQLMKDNLNFETAQDLIDTLQDLDMLTLLSTTGVGT